MIKAIIFDCFGVLVTDALEAMVATMREREPATAAEIVSVITAANKGIISPDVSRESVAQLLGLSTDEYVRRIRAGETKNYELLAYIRLLRPQYKTALLSNVSARGLDVRFSPEELAAHFDTVVASGVVGFAKPDAHAYEITADRLGIRCDECIMIDDREEYCDGARTAGMQAIRYYTFDQLRTELSPLLTTN